MSRISHLDYVTVEDLTQVGVARPAARRLLDAVKKRKGTLRKKLLQTFTQNNGMVKETIQEKAAPPTVTLTCLIRLSCALYYLCYK